MSGTTSRARIRRGLTDERAHERTLRAHPRIVEALERHQPELAAARATVHIAGVEEWLMLARANAS
jgi:DNA-binding FadR family transcriptional regulator